MDMLSLENLLASDGIYKALEAPQRHVCVTESCTCCVAANSSRLYCHSFVLMSQLNPTQGKLLFVSSWGNYKMNKRSICWLKKEFLLTKPHWNRNLCTRRSLLFFLISICECFSKWTRWANEQKFWPTYMQALPLKLMKTNAWTTAVELLWKYVSSGNQKSLARKLFLVVVWALTKSRIKKDF